MSYVDPTPVPRGVRHGGRIFTAIGAGLAFIVLLLAIPGYGYFERQTQRDYLAYWGQPVAAQVVSISQPYNYQTSAYNSHAARDVKLRVGPGNTTISVRLDSLRAAQARTVNVWRAGTSDTFVSGDLDRYGVSAPGMPHGPDVFLTFMVVIAAGAFIINMAFGLRMSAQHRYYLRWQRLMDEDDRAAAAARSQQVEQPTPADA